MISDAPNINQAWAKLIVEELIRQGVSCFCLSPGSRCTPLTVAVARHTRAEGVVHFDERGAAFHALGAARGRHVPTALICTSGSAAANYWPAVVEAAQSQTPLILLTADRPPELLDTGANQTIRQSGLYGGYVRWSMELPCPDPAVAPESVLTAVDQAVYRALRAPAGPVHLNCPFREPLAPAHDPLFDADRYALSLADWAKGQQPYTLYTQPHSYIEPDYEGHLLLELGSAARGLLVVGALATREQRIAVTGLAQALQWPVFADITSSLRTGVPAGTFIPHYDLLLQSERFQSLCRPDVVLHLGGAVTSKRLQQHLENVPPRMYIRVAPHPARHDPAHQVTWRIEAAVAPFAHWLADAVQSRGVSDWTRCLQQMSETVGKVVACELSEADSFSQPVAAHIVSRHIAPGHGLFLGNSLPVREMDMFAAHDGPTVLVASNRGASGIDGNIATAAGFARGLGAPVTAFVGDLTLLHDLNSLALVRNNAAPVIVVVINNDGGGIFHFLPISEHRDVFDRYFATPHGLRFHGAAAMFGLPYYSAANAAALTETYTNCLRRGQSALIEVLVNRDVDKRCHDALREAVLNAIAED